MAKQDKAPVETDQSKDTNPRGGQEDLNTPKVSDEPVTPPSQTRPMNPSDQIAVQIAASDARTKQPGYEFRDLTDEQVKDVAIQKGIDGNDGLTRDEIEAKIRQYDGKRMFDNPETNEQSPTSAEEAERVKREGVDGKDQVR